MAAIGGPPRMPPRLPPGQALDPAVCTQIRTGATLNITVNRYLCVAGLTIALYDIFLLASDEIELVWKSNTRPLMRLLYVFNRYAPPIFLVVANYQLAAFRGPLSSSLSTMDGPVTLLPSAQRTMLFLYALERKLALILKMLADIILLRVVALYGDSRKVRIPIYTLFFLSYGLCVAATVICIISLRSGMGYYIDFGGICNFNGSQVWFVVQMISPILFEFFAGFLTVYKACLHAYALWNSASFPLLHSLLRDGIFFSIMIVALRLCNTFIWTLLPSGSAYMGIYILWAPLSVMTTRFYLNMKNAATTDPFSPSYSSMMMKVRKGAAESRSTKFARISAQDFKSVSTTVFEPQRTYRDSFDGPYHAL